MYRINKTAAQLAKRACKDVEEATGEGTLSCTQTPHKSSTCSLLMIASADVLHMPSLHKMKVGYLLYSRKRLRKLVVAVLLFRSKVKILWLNLCNFVPNQLCTC